MITRFIHSYIIFFTKEEISMSSVKYVTSGAFEHFWSNMETYVLPKYIEKTESGVSAGTYASVTVNEHGIVTAGTELLDATKLNGIIPVANLPKTALERLVVVANKEAMLALTSDNVQSGDTVKLADTGVMYYVKDDTQLGTEEAFEPYKAGEAASVDWANVQNKPESLKNPNALTVKFADGVTSEIVYDGSATAEITIPNKLVNPNALTVTLPDGTSVEYDGSTAKTVAITAEALQISEVTTADIDTIMASFLPAAG